MIKKSLLIVSICCLIVLGFLGWVYVQEKAFLHYLYQEIMIEGKALAFTRPAKEIDFESGGLRLHGSVYLPRGKGPFPGIVLTHGGTSLGRGAVGDLGVFVSRIMEKPRSRLFTTNPRASALSAPSVKS